MMAITIASTPASDLRLFSGRLSVEPESMGHCLSVSECAETFERYWSHDSPGDPELPSPPKQYLRVPSSQS